MTRPSPLSRLRSRLRYLLPLLCLLLGFIPGAAAQEGEGELHNTPPKGISVDQVIQRFATKEKEFKLAREQ